MGSNETHTELTPHGARSRSQIQPSEPTTIAPRRGTKSLRHPRLACATRSAILSSALLACPIGIAVTVGVATLGVATNRDGAVLAGLSAAVVATVAVAVVVRDAIRTMAETERSLHELWIANDQLRQRNAELETHEVAIEETLEWIDEQTQGRLRELVDEAGDELATLVDAVLDAPGTSHEG